MRRLPWRIDSSESAIVSMKLGHSHLLQRRIVRDLQGKIHSFGGRTLISQRVSWAGPLVMCRSGRSAKDASFRLGASPLLLPFPVRRFPNSIAMSNPNLKTRYACSAVLLLFCVTIETPDAGSKGVVAASRAKKDIKPWLAKGFTRRRQQCHPLRSRPRLR